MLKFTITQVTVATCTVEAATEDEAWDAIHRIPKNLFFKDKQEYTVDLASDDPFVYFYCTPTKDTPCNQK